MKILVTGANGFTGRAFVRAAEAAGHATVSLRANLADAAALKSELLGADFDAVVHLAAISFVAHADDVAFYAVNTVGTANLLQALRQRPQAPRAVLLASSANVYGNSPNSPLSEDEPPQPVNHYAASKLAMEKIALTHADALPIFITRPFNYTGPGQAEQFLIPKLVKHFAQKAPVISLGNLHVEREFNDIDFVCEAYLGLLAFGETGQVYNICSGAPYTLHHVLDVLKALTGHTLEIQVNPAFVRANEVHRLCGSAQKLDALFARHGRVLHAPLLEQTLQRMLQAAG